MLTGLIAPTRGTASILGIPAPSPDAMGRVGFLPENPYVYAYLTPREFVTLCGRLSGMGGSALEEGRVVKVLERLGVAYAMDRAVRALSKGMLQRVGLAAALVHEPELLILDEPMSGLDPVGRKEVRDLIVEERRAGRTVFFSSHILSDVELLCDRVCILRQGEIVVAGSMQDLLGASGHRFEVTLRGASDGLVKELSAMNVVPRAMGRSTALEVEGDAQLRAVLEKALTAGANVEAVLPKRETLEDVFVKEGALRRLHTSKPGAIIWSIRSGSFTPLRLISSSPAAFEAFPPSPARQLPKPSPRYGRPKGHVHGFEPARRALERPFARSRSPRCRPIPARRSSASGSAHGTFSPRIFRARPSRPRRGARARYSCCHCSPPVASASAARPRRWIARSRMYWTRISADRRSGPQRSRSRASARSSLPR